MNRIKALEDRQKPSVTSLKKAILQYGLRSITEFDKYKALEMVEGLKNISEQVKDRKADYFRTVQSVLQERISKSLEHFKAYILSLLGDKDYDRIVESVSKVDRALEKEVASPWQRNLLLLPLFLVHLPQPLLCFYPWAILLTLLCPLSILSAPGFSFTSSLLLPRSLRRILAPLLRHERSRCDKLFSENEAISTW